MVAIGHGKHVVPPSCHTGLPVSGMVAGVIETTRRMARGFRNFQNYRLRNLISGGGHRPVESNPPTAPNY